MKKKIHLLLMPKEGINGCVGQWRGRQIMERIANLMGYVFKASNPSRPGKADVRKPEHTLWESQQQVVNGFLKCCKNGFCT